MAPPPYVAVKDWNDDAAWSDAKMDAFVDHLEDFLNDDIIAEMPNGDYFFGAVRASTTTSNDSIKVTSSDGTALAAAGPVLSVTVPSHSLLGNRVKKSITSDITLKISGAHWGQGTTGNITGMILRMAWINDGSATPALALAYIGNRKTVASTLCFTAQTSVILPEHVLVSRALNVGTWPMEEFGYCIVDFNDTGDVFTVQAGLDAVVLGKSADGMSQPWNPTYTGFSANPTSKKVHWTQFGQYVHLDVSLNQGTSNATGFTMTAPVKSKTNRNAVACIVVDNGAGVHGSLNMATSNNATITFAATANGGNFTGSGGKSANFNYQYEAFYG